MNRSDAKMIAEELHKFIRNDVRKAVTEMATAETEEYLNAKQAAVFLGWKLQTLYNRIHDIPHTKNGKSLIFIWGIERSGFFNGREKWAKGFENQRV